jgi:hypothetical protein
MRRFGGCPFMAVVLGHLADIQLEHSLPIAYGHPPRPIRPFSGSTGPDVPPQAAICSIWAHAQIWWLPLPGRRSRSPRRHPAGTQLTYCVWRLIPPDSPPSWIHRPRCTTVPPQAAICSIWAHAQIWWLPLPGRRSRSPRRHPAGTQLTYCVWGLIPPDSPPSWLHRPYKAINLNCHFQPPGVRPEAICLPAPGIRNDLRRPVTPLGVGGAGGGGAWGGTAEARRGRCHKAANCQWRA